MDDFEDEVALYCGRLTCGKVIVQTVGRGRRKEFCSESCRRAADKGYKRAKGRADLFGEQLRKTQQEVAAYGRKSEAGELSPDQVAQLESDARVALTSASGVLEWSAPSDRVRAELESLVSAIRPFLASRVQSDTRIA
jgi:hypothetical protein